MVSSENETGFICGDACNLQEFVPSIHLVEEAIIPYETLGRILRNSYKPFYF
jgi:hypothetical protein